MWLTLLVAYFLLHSNNCADNIIVQTPLGKVSGYVDSSYGGRTFLSFKGIPYAKAPVGDLRFKEPIPIESWEPSIWNATASSACPQLQQKVVGNEDCLHINVYVPRETINTEEKLEVIVYIHGGGFTSGSGTSVNPTHAMDKDVILVTFNYRLGILGFLSTEDEVLPGNNGFKDQVQALKWVQENIASFGGNPNSVTLVGLSAGSFSVHSHYFSESSRDLFHRGVCQSGVLLSPTGIVEGNLDRAKTLAKSLDCPTDNTQNLVDCLRLKPYEEIVNKLSLFLVFPNIPIHPFGHVIEKVGPNPFLKEDPFKIITEGRVAKVPILVSNVKDEGTLFTGGLSNDNINYINDNWDQIAPVLFDFNYTLPKDDWKSVSDKIREHYFSDGTITKQNLLQPFLARFWLVGSDDTIKLHANVTQSKSFYYFFAYPGDSGTTVGHGGDSKYFFGTGLTENELKMKDLLWDMIVSYAKTNVPKIGSLDWKPTTFGEDIYLEIDGIQTEEIYSLTKKELTNVEFWKSFNFSENNVN